MNDIIETRDINILDNPVEIDYGKWIIEHPECDAVFDKTASDPIILIYAYATSKKGNKALRLYRDVNFKREGIRYVLNVLYDRYHLPLFIVENGIGLDEQPDENGEIKDGFRKEYIHDHLVQIREALLDGVEVMGYLYWGPIDIVSAGTGEMRKRYGFVYVDRFNDGSGTLERRKKDSYDWFRKVIESNGENLSL